MCLVVLALLLACSKQQKYDVSRLDTVRTLQVNAQISAHPGTSTNAMPRGQRAGSGAVGGAVLGASIWVSDPLLLAAAIIAPVAVLATTAVGGVIGGVAGAATGISASEDQILAAVSVLDQSFEPASYQQQFATEFAKSLEDQFAPTSNVCVAARPRGRKCPRSGGTGKLTVIIQMEAVPSKGDGGAGGIDIASNVLVRSKPSNLLQPECLGWIHRVRAGNLIELANDGGKPFEHRVQRILSEIARDLPYAMLNDRAPAVNETSALKNKKHAESQPGVWKKGSCR